MSTNYRPLPISEYQKRFFVEWMLAPTQSTYNESIVYKITGDLDKKRFKRACEIFTQRHEILHAKYDEEGKHCYYSNYRIEDFYHELTVDNYQDTHLQLRRLINKPFDLTKDALFRFFLLQNEVKSQEYYFIVSVHHIILDGAFSVIFTREFKEILEAVSSDDPVHIESSPTFTQAVNAESQFLSQFDSEEAKKYWLNFISDLPIRVQLPYKPDVDRRQLNAVSSDKSGELIYIELDESETIALKKYARKNESTLFIVLSAIYGLILSKYANQEKIFLSYPVDMRQPGYYVTGCFINNLPLKIELDKYNTLSELIAGLTAQRKAVKNHQAYSFHHIIQDQRHVNGISDIFFNVSFAQMNQSIVPFDLKGVKVEVLTLPDDQRYAELHLSYDDSYNILKFKLEYRAKLFDKNTMMHFGASLRTLIEHVTKQSDILLKSYNVLDRQNYQQIVYDWNQTAKPYCQNKTIHQLFEEQVARTPDNMALIYEDIQLIYTELNQKANQLAHYLRDTYAIRGDDLIALCLERSEQMIIAILGVLKSGAAYVPVDPAYPEERIRYILEDTQVKVMIDAAFQAKWQPVIARQSTDNLSPMSESHHLAYVIYTSGTTGKPKGVMIEHSAYIQTVSGIQTTCFESQQPLNTFSVTHYAFDIFGLEYGLPLLSGGFLELGTHEFTMLDCASYHFIQMTPSVCELKLKDLKNTHTTQLFVGGEVLKTALINDIQSKNIRLIHFYGPTETTIWSTKKHYHTISLNEKVLIGKALPHETTYILNSRHQPLPIGVVGELCIGGVGLARGYLNQPELTAEKFIINPFEHNTRLYKTGDLARYLPDGNIEYVGRNDSQVKIRGFRIELAEIEQALLNIAGIQQACVLAKLPSEESGNNTLLGYYVLNKNPAKNHNDTIINTWKTLYDTDYAIEVSAEAIADDFTSWNSFITAVPIPLHEMQEWRDLTVSRIQTLSPQHVLEIGVGSGLLMYPLLSRVVSYTGLDFSQHIINRHIQYLKNTPYTVEFHTLAADQIDALENKYFDCIILNSVCQYFPSMIYFEEVLMKALNRLSPAGHVFLGDIRNHDTHETLIQEKLTYQRRTYTSAEVNQWVQKENELLISPQYFLQLAQQYPALRIEILDKQGTSVNELTKYRYDVIVTRQNATAFDKILSVDTPWPLYNLPYLNKITTADVLSLLSKSLPDYMLPHRLIEISTLPLTINGKVNHKALLELEWRNTEIYVAPRNEIEKQISMLYANVFGLQVEKIGLHDDFFHLGGNSLIAIRTAYQLSQMFNVQCSVAEIFVAKTVEKLAQFVEKSRRGENNNTSTETLTDEQLWIITQSAIVNLDAYNTVIDNFLLQIRGSGNKTPLFVIPGGWGDKNEMLIFISMASHFDPERPVYGILSRAMDPDWSMSKTLKKQATIIFNAIKKIQPYGPYYFIGECIAGNLAIELAGLAEAQGERPGITILLDSHPRMTKKKSIPFDFSALKLPPKVEQYYHMLCATEPKQSISEFHLLLSSDKIAPKKIFNQWKIYFKSKATLHLLKATHSTYVRQEAAETVKVINAILER